MADIINTNPSTLLEDFQSAYFNQMGKRMTIGSEEYALSSVFTYVLSLYAGLVNNSYKNQCIDTASGVFLDNIAARYDLSRTPEVYSNPWFEGLFTFQSACAYYGRSYEKNNLSINVGGHTYTNENSIASATNNVPIRFVCTEPHNDYLNKSELKLALREVKDSNDVKVFSIIRLMTYNLSDMQGIANELSDDELRDYIKMNKQLYVPGVAGSFEALAKSSSKDIVDARVRVQGDEGFRPGYVDLFCRPYAYARHSEYSDLIRAIDIPNVSSVIAQKNIAVIGQQVNVYGAEEITDSRRYVFYVPKAYDTEQYYDLYQEKFIAIEGYLNNSLKINESYIPTMAVNLMTKSLAEISTNLADFGIAQEDTNLRNRFSKYENLPVIGLESLSDYSKLDSSPTSYIHVSHWALGFEFI